MKKILLLSLAVILLCWIVASAIGPSIHPKNAAPAIAHNGQKALLTASSKQAIASKSKVAKVQINQKDLKVQKEAVGNKPLTAKPVIKVEQPKQAPASEPTTIAGAKPPVVNNQTPKPAKAEPVRPTSVSAPHSEALENHQINKVTTIAPPPDPNVILQGGDDFASATPVGPLPYTDAGTTVGYAHNYTLSCLSNATSPDVVYSYAPSADGSVNASLCGSSFDTGIGIYDNNPSTQIACNDDFCSVQSEVDNVPVLAGHTYYIVVTGYGGASGAYTLTVSAPPPPSPGDNCGDPIIVSIPGALPYTDVNHTCGRLDDYNNTCLGYYDGGEDIIYQIDVTQDGCYNFALDPGTSTYAGIAVDGSCPPNPTTCIAVATNYNASPFGCYGVNLTAGTYYVMIDTWPSPTCIPSFTLNITACSNAPANDDCANAQAVTGPYPVTVSGTTIGATVDCPGLLNWNAVWYTIDLPYAVNQLSIDYCPTNAAINNIGIVYFADCSCTNYQGFSYTWPTCGSGYVDPLLTATVAGPTTIYYPAWPGSTPMDFGITVNVTEYVPPTPDFQVTAPGEWTDGNTCGAGDDCNLRVGEDQIWEVTIPTDGIWIFSMCNSPTVWDSYIYLGTASCMSDLGYNDDGCGGVGLSQITAQLTAGTYYLTVEGYSSTYCGAYTLDINEAPPAPWNDQCDAVTPVPLADGVPVQFTGDNTGATTINDCSSFASYPNVWVAFSTDTCMNITLDYCGTTPAWGDAWLNIAIDCPCTGFTAAGSFDQTTCPDGNVTIRWSMLPAGNYYYPIMLDPANNAGPGPYVVNVVGTICPPPPPNDNCQDATDGGTLTPGVPMQFTGNNSGATVDCANLGYREAWVTFTLDVCQDVVIDYCGTTPTFGNVFIVYETECPCGTYTYVSNYAQTCPDGNWAVTIYGMQPGQYWYPILTDAGSEGPYVINVNGTECPPPPENDYCAQATPIGDVTDLPWSTRSATFDGAGACMTSPNIWYTYTASCDGNAMISTCGSSFATDLAVYQGTACPEAPIMPDPVALQGGENVPNATVIPGPLPAVYTGTTVGYVNDYTLSCLYGTAPDVVYSYAPVVDQVVTVTLCGSTYDTGLGIFEDIEGNEIACDDDYCGLQSGVQGVHMNAGHTYYIVVSGFSTNSGDYTLNMITTDYVLLGCSSYACGALNGSQLIIPVTAGQQLLVEIGGTGTLVGDGVLSTSCAPPPPNDNCTAVTPVDLPVGNTLTFTGDNTGASNDCSLLSPTPEVWEAVTTTECADITIDYCGTTPAFGNVFIVITDACPCGTLIYANSYAQTCPDGNWAVQFNGVPAGTYYLPVLTEPGDATGPYTMNVTAVACPPPPPDYCASSVYNNGLPTGYAYGTQCAPGYPFNAGMADDFILPGTGPVTIDTVVAYFNFWNGTGTPDLFGAVAVTIYANDPNNNMPAGIPVANDPACGYQETLPGGIISTQTIAVGSFSWGVDPVSGNYLLMLPIADVILDAGTTYWLQVTPQMEFPPQCGWVNTDVVTGSSALQVFPLLGIPNWSVPSTGAADMSFCLLQATPPTPPILIYSPHAFVDSVLTGHVKQDTLLLHNVGIDNLIYGIHAVPSTWLSVAPDTGIVPATLTDTVVVTIDASAQSPGIITGTITLLSNEPDRMILSLYTIPVTINVLSGGGNCHYIVGDANHSLAFNGLDVTYSVAYFKGGPPPPYSCLCGTHGVFYVSGDVNASCSYNGLDVTYMVAYFKGGPLPHPCPDCPPSLDIMVAPKPLNLQSSGQ